MAKFFPFNSGKVLALAAIGATGTVVNFYLMAITGFTLGLSILFAHKSGSGENKAIPEILSSFFLLFGVGFFAFAALGIWLAYPILRLLHTTGDTIRLAGDYLRIIFAGIPFLAVYNVYSAALRGIGDSRAPFLAILFSSAVNVVLDILFVACLHWGVKGAAAATVISQAAMTAFLILYAVAKHPLLRFCPGGRLLYGNALEQGFRLGIPPMIQSSVSAFGSLLLQNFMNGFGTRTVAAITTAYRVDTIILLPIINLGSGISTIVARNHGAGEEGRAKRVLAVGTAMMAAVSLFLTILVIPTGGRVIAMFGVGAGAAKALFLLAGNLKKQVSVVLRQTIIMIIHVWKRCRDCLHQSFLLQPDANGVPSTVIRKIQREKAWTVQSGRRLLNVWSDS